MLTPSLLMCAVMMMVVVTEGQQMRRGNGDDDIPACAMDSAVYQRSRRECPERAVCADVWNTIRDWYNGTRCRDQRVMYNCMCAHGQQCPIDNPDHRLYGNEKHSQYMCQPACDLSRCNSTDWPAREMVASLRNPRSYRYYRINCRCLNHHVPLPSRGRRGLNRATVYKRLFFDYQGNKLYTQYRCVNTINQNQDPCDSFQ